MATHDYVIDNASGSAVRTDLNNVLQAILTNNSSSSAPSTTAAYMWWADTTNGVLKIRNSNNTDWVELLQLDGTLTLEDGSASTPGLAFRDDLNTGIFSSAADTFNVATAGVERMELGATTIFNEDGADVDFRIEGDTDANLFYVDAGNDRIGINESTPNSLLQLSQASADTVLELHRTDTNTSGGVGMINFTASDGHSLGSIGMIGDGDNEGGNIIFKTTSAAASNDPFNAATPTVMTLDSAGRLLVGRTSSITIASDPSDHNFEQLTNNGMVIACNCDQANQRGIGIFYTAGKNASDFFRCHVDTTPKIIINGSGNVANANNSYGSTSDISLKENIVDAKSQWNDIKNIKVRNYNFKQSTGQSTHTQIGVIAQELETVSPKLIVTSEEDELKSVQYSVLYMKAVKALQEAQTRIETLETKVAALEAA
mgnify:CR=1 FL=1